MSNYPNGSQPYYHTYSQQPSYNTPVQGQQHQQQQHHQSQQTSSFDVGNDGNTYPGQVQPQAGSGYTPYGAAPPQAPYQQYMPGAPVQASIPYRPNVQSYGIGAYQHQNQPAPTTTASTYNPAHYAPTYNPASYSSPTQSYQGSSPQQPYQHQPYQHQTYSPAQQITPTGQFFAGAQQSYTPAPNPPSRTNTNTNTYGAPANPYGGYYTDTQQSQAFNYQQGYSSTAYQTSYQTASPPAPLPPLHQEAPRPYNHSASPSYSQPAASSQWTSTSTTSQAPPEIHRNASSASQMSGISNPNSSLATSPQPLVLTPPVRNPSQGSPTRGNNFERHPQGRTLPGLPSESESDGDYFIHPQRAGGASGYDDLLSDLDAAIGNTTLDPLFDPRASAKVSPDQKPTHLNGVVSTGLVSTGDHHVNYGAFSNDSDAEAAAGLAAMQEADAQEAAEEQRRRSSNNVPSSSSSQPAYPVDRSDDSDYAGYDLSLAGGGYHPFSSYAPATAVMPTGDYSRLNPRMESVRSTGVSSDGKGSQTSGFESIPPSDSVHPFPPLRTDIARVDTGGTGGLTEASSAHPRRMSFEENDEEVMVSAHSPLDHTIPDLFFHPGMSPHRPLPPPPSNSDPGRGPRLAPIGTSNPPPRYPQYDANAYLQPAAAEINQANNGSVPVPRSTSLASSRISPRAEQPMRSKTDADRARLQKQGRYDLYEINSPQSAVALDLPTIPRKKFNPSKISSEQYRKCAEPWALSSVVKWVKDLADEEIDLKEGAIAEAIVGLFTHKVPTMNTTEAELLGEAVVGQMLRAGALVKEEEWVKFGPGEVSGVLYQLTGIGCYSSKLHLYHTKGRCYSYHCMRTLKKVDLTLPTEKKSEDWHTYYKLTKDDLDKYDKKEVERQMNQHEIVTGEEKYIAGLELLRSLYRDSIESAQPPILPTKKIPAFIRDVFGVVDKVKKVNEDFLLAQLKYRQNEQGPFIVGFSDIFREWIRRARTVYVEYATNYPRADYLMRKEAERNLLFSQYLDQARLNPQSQRLSWDNYLKSPIQRLQRYGLLLDTVMKNMVKDSSERLNLTMAIDEIKTATHDANQAFAKAEKEMELIELQMKMKLRKNMEVVELNLDHKGRQIHMRGNLLRQSTKGFQMVDTHAILFDHYLVLAKQVVSRDSTGNTRNQQYDVSKTPIPMDLISLESVNDPAVVKSSMKGIAVTTQMSSSRGPNPTDPRLARTTSTNSGSTLQHTQTGFSVASSGASGSLVPSTTLADSKDDKVLYPFKLKHLGKEDIYTLFATSAENRAQWCAQIIFAKEQHAEALHAQHAEPFKLRVLADTAFGIESYTAAIKGVLIKETPLHRALQEAEKRYHGSGRPAPICRAPVNCATVFQQPYGKYMCAIGTDYGVYISEFSNPRGWVRAIQMSRVTQIAVLEEFNLFVLIADKVLIAYHLDVVCPASGPVTVQNESSMRKAPQKLSGAKDVGFFVAGRMKDRALVFYKKRDGMNSVFKVLEPVLQKSATTRSRFLPTSSRRGQTDFFREYDEFYIPTECFGINLFHSSLAIATSRGVEVLTLDKKQPWSVPNLRSESTETQQHLTSIAARIKDLKPLGMFRLSQSEFLVAFEECAVYVNQHGDISRGVVMEFVGRAKSACLYEQYLILCDSDFVEIRDAQNGRLKQVIAGKEMRLLDDGGNLMPGTRPPNPLPASAVEGGANGMGIQGVNHLPRSVKLCMIHPEYEKSYVIVELLFVTDNQGISGTR